MWGQVRGDKWERAGGGEKLSFPGYFLGLNTLKAAAHSNVLFILF
jgi:hypothetical protein